MEYFTVLFKIEKAKTLRGIAASLVGIHDTLRYMVCFPMPAKTSKQKRPSKKLSDKAIGPFKTSFIGASLEVLKACSQPFYLSYSFIVLLYFISLNIAVSHLISVVSSNS